MTTEITTVPDVAEWSAAEVEQWLGRRHGWAKRHITELGGYREETTREDGAGDDEAPVRFRYRFPVHRIRAWQVERAAEFAAQKAGAA